MKTNRPSSLEQPSDFWTGLLPLLLIACLASWMGWRFGSDGFSVVAEQGVRFGLPGADICLAFQ